MKLSLLLEGICQILPEDVEITDVTASSRLTVKGTLFFAVKGEKLNGEDFISDAVKNGASAVVVSDSTLKEKNDAAEALCIRVPDVRSALSIASARLHKNTFYEKRTRLVAITGTNGKTTTAYMTAHILASAGYKVAVMGTLGCGFFGEVNFSDGMTTPGPEKFYPTVSEFQKNGVDFIIFEASSQGIAQRRLDGIPYSGLEAELAAFTNLSHEHLDYHATMEEYFEVKKRLFCDFGFLKKVINIGGEYGKRLFEAVGGVSYGDDGADFNIGNVRSNGADGVSYTLSVCGDEYEVKCPIPGTFTAENSAMAIAMAVSLGVSPCDAANAIGNFGGVRGRMEFICDEPLVIIDFAHTPRAMAELLKTVRGFSGDSRITVLFGCGGDRDRTKRPVMGKIASELSDHVIITSDNSRTENTEDIINDIMKGVPTTASYSVIPDRREAIEFAVMTAKRTDVIILAGKGHENYEDKGGRKLPFCEREIVMSAMKKRKENGG